MPPSPVRSKPAYNLFAGCPVPKSLTKDASGKPIQRRRNAAERHGMKRSSHSQPPPSRLSDPVAASAFRQLTGTWEACSTAPREKPQGILKAAILRSAESLKRAGAIELAPHLCIGVCPIVTTRHLALRSTHCLQAPVRDLD